MWQAEGKGLAGGLKLECLYSGSFGRISVLGAQCYVCGADVQGKGTLTTSTIRVLVMLAFHAGFSCR